ncbi:formylglycine-generating enzyme family protein [Parahaliea mediterranea]|uniref:SUMF1/EgtB/PvdO family nonheme iron enzyme n=1 Tax=Parahaliea mediterranea TaxID=651086 RepID=A0A939IN82_9GAMM|nr:SUMF1/EgtB/PvdO family nonheme iron enzyme [Parahaliea mediterranea]MBN7797838.1 SUMF1/EgtB/PvdO family nonheme iron enzyme [Parahaliea mediterranea]
MTLKQVHVTILFIFAICTGLVRADEYFSGQEFTEKLKSGGDGPTMIVLPRGKFVIGGGKAGPDGAGEITIDYPLALATTETTRAQYRHFLAATLSAALRTFPEGGDDLPVTGISWDDAEAYATWLSRETGHYYRLPSSSEWEYAARAGSQQLYSWGDEAGDKRANCMNCGTSLDGQVAPVGGFAANGWGLYDMHGNVWEWTKDCIDANSAPPANGMPQLFGNCELRELRGGSAQSDAWSIRATARASAPRKTRMADVGFRIAREIQE